MRFGSHVEAVLPVLFGVLAVVLLAAAVVAYLLTPPIARAAARLGIVDRPGPRRVHLRPIPRGGGLAAAVSFVGIAGAFLWANDQVGWLAGPATLDGRRLLALLGGSMVAALLGLLDDALELRARWQLLGQLVVAGWAVALGIGVQTLQNPLGGIVVLGDAVAVAFTLLWIVGMINSMNFIDGQDGLSTGIALIAAVTLGLISLTATVDQPLVAVLCFALSGALLGFLRWNFHPAQVFTGTSGVMFVGYALAVLAILGTAKVAVALLALGVPIIDTFWIIVRRLAARRSPFAPDRGHFHHRLLDLGLSHTQAVLLIYAICVVLAVLSLVLSGTGQVYAFLGLVVGLGLVLFVLARRSLVAEALQAASYEGSPEGSGRSRAREPSHQASPGRGAGSDGPNEEGDPV